jgi:hypothetical protein
MRTVRNLSFVVLCLSFVHTGGGSLWAACQGPGLFGSGDTESEAVEDCESGAENACLQHCGAGWVPEPGGTSCQVQGGGPPYVAAGSTSCKKNDAY